MTRAAAPRVRLQLPVLLEPVVGRSLLEVRGRHIGDVLEAACVEVPVLRHHLMLEGGQLRPHILCLHNGVNIRRDRLATTAVAEGDEILIHQAISGG